MYRSTLNINMVNAMSDICMSHAVDMRGARSTRELFQVTVASDSPCVFWITAPNNLP